MSQVKKHGLRIFLMLTLLLFFMAGCKDNSVAVEDIYFNLKEGEQIVLLVGQTFDVADSIEIRPNYASNKKFSISSFNEEIIQIEGTTLKAIGEGNTQIRVVSNDSNLKEDLMTVVVKKTKTTLSTPRNLTYDSSTQTVRFDTVPSATSYTLKVNEEEIELGNSNLYNLSQFENVFDTLVSISVRANAPSYTYALENSSYSDTLSIYQAGSVQDIEIKNGILSFTKTDENLNCNIFINNNLLLANTDLSQINLNTLPEVYAGQNVEVEIETIVSDEIKTELGEDVLYYNSTKQSVPMTVLDVPNLSIKTTKLEWQNIANVKVYAIEIDNVRVGVVENNYFELSSIDVEISGHRESFETLITSSNVHQVKVLPILDENVFNIGQTIAESVIKLKRLESVQIVCSGSNLTWQYIEKASAYSFVLETAGENLESSTVLNGLSMEGFSAGDYKIKMQAIASELPDENDVYYVSSQIATKEFSKCADIEAVIEDYHLIISNLGNDTAFIDFDNGIQDIVKPGNGSVVSIDLGEYEFEAGPHQIVITRCGDNDTILDSSDHFENFIQLEKIETMTIAGGTLCVERSDYNENAIIKLSTTGGQLQDPYVVENVEVTFDTENHLKAGDYVAEVYVYGDGSSTFSYRENNEVVPTASITFTVLAVPTLSLTNPAVETLSISEVSNAESYNVFKVDGENVLATRNTETLEQDLFEFEMFANYSVQAIGDGERYLDSAKSTAICVTRLETPSLTYNSKTQKISKFDPNESDDPNEESVVNGYVISVGEETHTYTKDGVHEEYDFNKVHNFMEDTTLSLQILANVKVGDNYYLNSNVFSLTLLKISNVATIILDEENNLVVETVEHDRKFDLEVLFTFGSTTQKFVTNEDVLTDGHIELVYTYAETDGKKIFTIDLIDDDYNAIIESLNEEFSVQVKFLNPENSLDPLINSEFTSASTLNLNRIDSETAISINANNQIVVQPSNHEQEYALSVKINEGTEKTLVSNGEGFLIYGDDEIKLPYTYDNVNRTYLITILNDDYSSIINLNSTFTVQVKYMYHHNGVSADLDSDFCLAKTLNVLPQVELTRDGQMLKFNNAKNGYTYLNYALIINNSHNLLYFTENVLKANEVEGGFEFDVEYIYSNSSDVLADGVNSVSVLVLNASDENATELVSRKSEEILIQKTATVELSSYKYNDNEDGLNNNSAVVNFNTYTADYDKIYHVEIYNNGEANKQIPYFADSDAHKGKISFNMDDISGIEGQIYLRAFVTTNGTYVSDGKTVNVFNSTKSQVITLTKITTVTGVSVSNSVLTFGGVQNAVGYEIYKKEGTDYIKLNNAGLLTGTQYSLAGYYGEMDIYIKAISSTQGYSNSSYSDKITVSKLASPKVSIVDGKFHVNVADIATLVLFGGVSITPTISNSQTENITINLKDMQDGMKLYGTTLVAEPYLFLSYMASSLSAENLSVFYQVENSMPSEKFYLNSDVVNISVHGLFKPTSVSKTTNDTLVEQITWKASDKNVINGNNVAGFVFKLEHTVNDETTPYYSNDPKLKFFNAQSGKYESYPSKIDGLSALFPAGYGSSSDKLDVEFKSGMFKISVQAVPLVSVEGYNLASSQYSDILEFEMLASPEPIMMNGEVVWNVLEKANKYQVTIYEDGEDEALFVDTVTTAKYDFTNAALKSLSGVYKVVVKAISTNVGAVNSKESAPIYIYRLPEASSVHIEDGYLVLSATAFFESADITFIDKKSTVTCPIPHDNLEIANKKLTDLIKEESLTSWAGFAGKEKINSTTQTVIKLDGETLKVLDGRDYLINVVLKGNSNTEFGFVNSSTVLSLSNLTATKLRPNLTEVKLGVMQFMVDDDYATVTDQGVYTTKEGVDINYVFNDGNSSIFWNNTALYRIEITHSEGKLNVYAVDYFSFSTAISKNLINANEYEMKQTSNGLYAIVKYSYLENETTKTIYFNVYENNIINLKDYDSLYYYATTETMLDGVNKFESVSAEMQELDLTIGGSFTFNIYMLGGDSKDSAGYLTANVNNLKTFVRYALNELNTSSGKLQFNNQLPVVDGKTIDNPVYKIDVVVLNGLNVQTFYVYHDSEENAKLVAQRFDSANYLNAVYEKVEIDKENENLILFDLSQHINAGVYKISITTLAGLGTSEDDANYLLNSKLMQNPYPFYKLYDTNFVADNGFLVFNQSYILRGDEKIYCDSYEITLFDPSSQDTYIYEINRSSVGVTIDDATHIVKYELPNSVKPKDKETVLIAENKNYEIQVRAMAVDNNILNGTYIKQNGNNVLLEFKKSQGITSSYGNQLRVEDGILKWRVLNPEAHEGTMIRVTFYDENDQIKLEYIPVSNLNKVVENGEYMYHYYDFTDDKYKLDGGENYIIDAYVMGKTTSNENILNSNYSSSFETTRLMTVGNDIKTVDGVLTWNEIEDAVSYNVILVGTQRYEVTVETNSLDTTNAGLDLPTGTYSVAIRANGSTNINSSLSKEISGLFKLDSVIAESIETNEGKIVWDEVENAQKYKVVFEYTDIQGLQQTETKLVETNEYTAPAGVVGTFKVSVAPIGDGEGKLLNGSFVTFESSKANPTQVKKVSYNFDLNRFEIEVNTEDFLSSDKLLISYDFAEYSPNKETGLIEAKTAISQTARMNYSKGKAIYYYPLTTMAVYSNIYVQVLRPETLPSPAVGVENLGEEKVLNLHLFSYGSGAFDNVETLDVDESNPYRISSAEELLNIKYFISANYVLTQSINFSSGINLEEEQTVNDIISERIETYNALIADEFKGTIDGNNYSIFGFNIDEDAGTDTLMLESVNNFALFNTLNEATIKNLTFGQENIQLILLNTFAKQTADVVKLSLIATGANNSTIENIKVLDMKFELSSTEIKSNGKIFVAGLVQEMTNTKINNAIIDISVDVDMGLSTSVQAYVGGVATNATNSNIQNSNITFNVETKADNILNYVGGVVAYYVGNAGKTTGIINTNVLFTMENVSSVYIGGLVGFASMVKINKAETTGYYKNLIDMDYCYVGGLVGYAQSSKIETSGSLMEIDVAVSNNQYKYIGAIVGTMSVYSNISCEMIDCYSHVYNKDNLQTQISSTATAQGYDVTVGVYGSATGANITVTGCYKKEQ